MSFVLAVYRYSESFPERESMAGASAASRGRFHSGQHRRGAFGKRSPAEKSPFPDIAEGSVEECRYYLILSKTWATARASPLTSTLEETSKLLNGLCPGDPGFRLLTSGFYILKDNQGEALG